MKESMKHFYSEEYYRQRNYEFAVRYPFFDIIAKTLVERFNPKRVLDVGCVKGYLVYAFNEMHIEAYGVDISEYAISQSPENVRGLLLNIDVDSEKLPFQPETFDMVTALECMEHLQNHNHLISEMNRVLKPGGIVLIKIPKKYWDRFIDLFIKHNPTHINMHSKSFWVQAFESQHFHYIGDLPKDVKKDLTRAQKKWVSGSPPTTRKGEFLVKLGKIGKWLREKLASGFAREGEALLFRS